MPSSLISTVTRHQDHMPGDLADDAECLVLLVEVLARLPDARRTRGRRYRLGALLVLCGTAVLAEASAWAVVVRFAAGLDPVLRERIGLLPGIPRTCARAVSWPVWTGGASTRRWAPGCNCSTHPLTDPAPGSGLVEREAVSVDGRPCVARAPASAGPFHLPAAAIHGTRTVIALR